MERLTKRRDNGNSYVTDEHCFDTWANSFEGTAIDRLAYYEDMEEQGRLVVLPCKLEADIFRLGVKEVCGYWQVAYAEVYLDEIVMVDDSDNVFTEADIGKTVFLTREDAERALKEGADHENS